MLLMIFQCLVLDAGPLRCVAYHFWTSETTVMYADHEDARNQFYFNSSVAFSVSK